MASPLSPSQWQEVFLRQAAWTRPAREHLYRTAGLRRAQWVLDVGCGAAAITSEMAAGTRGRVVGLDIDAQLLGLARERSRIALIQGDAHRLPFSDGAFDVSVTHFVLLWLRDPAVALREMGRVTRPGGWVLACAEPDYGGRIDHPDLPIGRWQAEALRREGADPCAGRKLREWFAQAGLAATVSLISAPWDLDEISESKAGERELLERTTASFVTPDEHMRMRQIEDRAIELGGRFVFMPVFCASAQRPR